MKFSVTVGLAVCWGVIGACLSLAPTPLFAAQVTALQAAGVATCEYSTAADTLVLEYHVTLGEFVDSDPIPRLQVFGDGRVRVHYPRYMKNSGDFERWLSQPEMEALVESLVTKGVLDFDENSVQAAIEESVSQRRLQARLAGQEQVATYTADAAVTTLGIYLERYVPADRALPARRNLAKRIHWRSLSQDAQSHPEVGAINRLSAFVKELSALTEHKGLERLDN